MKILLCKPDFPSFLSAVYHAFYTHRDAGYIGSDIEKCSLLDTCEPIICDFALAEKVRCGIINRYGYNQYNNVYTAYLSCDIEKEQKIFMYLRLLFRYGKAVNSMFGTKEVVDFNDLLNKVNRESVRMIEFIRLQEMENGIYYGFFCSDNDVLEKIAPHFLERFNIQKFVLHDVKRKKMLFYDGTEYFYLPAPEIAEIELSEKEAEMKQLWKTYFKSVTIDSRINRRQQNQFLPQKYRFFMSEFS